MPTRFFLGFLLAILGFLFFPKLALAAITITSIDPATITSADQVITITATASGLSDKTQYLQVGLTKEGESPHYFGYTRNNSGTWYVYKSSPPPAEFSSYFYNFTPASGSWSGNILAKADTADPDFKGPGNYSLKLMKYISSSSPTYSINSVTVAINIAPPSPPPPENTQSSSPPPPANEPAPAPETPLDETSEEPAQKPNTIPATPTQEPEINLILGTVSAATKTPVPTQVPESPKSQVPNKPGVIPVAIVFIALGTVLSSVALLSVRFRIWEKWPIKV